MIVDDGVEAQRELWAWVTQDSDGRVSLVGALVGGMHMPLLNHRRDKVENMRGIAHAHGKAMRQRVWLRHYTVAQELDDA